MLECSLAQINQTVFTAFEMFLVLFLPTMLSEAALHCPAGQNRPANQTGKQNTNPTVLIITNLICSILFMKCRASVLWNVPTVPSPHYFINQGLLAFISTLCWLTPTIYGHRDINGIQQHHRLLQMIVG